MLWRATLLFPLCLLATTLVLVLGLGRFLFPLFVALNMYTKDWPAAFVYSVAWILAMVIWRWQRFQDLLEEPPSLL